MPGRWDWTSTIVYTTAEALAEAGETFDAVLNMEVVEHVADPQAYLERLLGVGQTRRHSHMLDDQPQSQKLHDGDHRRGTRDALAAEGHA